MVSALDSGLRWLTTAFGRLKSLHYNFLLDVNISRADKNCTSILKKH